VGLALSPLLVVAKMNVRELQDVLHKLENVYAAAGAKKQAGSIAALAKSISGNPELPIDDLIADLRNRLTTMHADWHP
jgi:hypothetical protein